MKNENLLEENIQISLNYLGRKLTIEAKKFKTLHYIKKKVYEYFYPISKEVIFIHNNRNLEVLMDEPLGYIFSGKKVVKLNILPEDSGNYTSIKILKRYKDSFYSSNNLYNNLNNNLNNKRNNQKVNLNSSISTNKSSKSKNCSLFSSSKNTNRLMNNVYNKNNMSNYSNKKLNGCASMDNIQCNKEKIIKNGKIKLPPINMKNIENINNNIKIDKNKCYECQTNKFTMYCRICDIFICEACVLKENSTHNLHKKLLLKIDKKTNKGKIKVYLNKITNQFKNNLNVVETNENFNKVQNNKTDFLEEEINKFNEYENKITNVSNGLIESLNKIDYQKIDNEKMEETRSLCNDYRMKYKKLNVNEYVSPFQPFFILNNSERSLANIFQKMNEEDNETITLKNKIQFIFQNIENELDCAISKLDSFTKNLK